MILKRIRRTAGLVVALLLAGMSPTAISQSSKPPASRPESTSASQPASQKAPQERQGNVFGINLGWGPDYSTVATMRLLGLARHLVGDWGYIRHGIADYDDVESARRSVAMIRAHHLIFISGGAAPLPEHREPGKEWPRLDSDGSMRTAAQAKARQWGKMYKAGIPFYVVEVMNEINGVWPAEKYAQWLYDFAVEVKAAYPGIKVCSCGMAGPGDDYYDQMLAFKPQLKEVVDFWGLHPYGANNPPEKPPGGTSLRSYELTAAVLKKHGVDPVRLMCTETGYELEAGETGKNPDHPPIREENRAEYMARAFRNYYVPDQRIEVVAPFMLWDLPWNGWGDWEFMYQDGRPRPIFEAVAAEPKPAGKDWLRDGEARILGRVTWGNTDIGVPRAVVYAVPEPRTRMPTMYAAVTDGSGAYQIDGLPEGIYSCRAFADGWSNSISSPPRGVKAARPARVNIVLQRASLIRGEFGDRRSGVPGGSPPGWTRLGPPVAACELDASVKTANQQMALRVRSDAESDFGMYKYGAYNSAYPFEAYLAEVFVQGERGESAAGGGPWLELALTGGTGQILSSTRVRPDDFAFNGRWYRLTVALFAPAGASRVRVAFGTEATRGILRFTEPFVTEADFPLQSDEWYKTTAYQPPRFSLNQRFFAQSVTAPELRNPKLRTARINGQVLDFRGRPLAHVAVATDEPCFVAVSDEQGRYVLTVPAGEKLRYRVRAFAPGSPPVVSQLVEMQPDQELTLDLKAGPPAAPAALVNGGFNTFSSREPGLLTGWTTYGTTDGAAAKPNIFVDLQPCEGEGMYFAGSGSNVKNGGAYQILQAEPGRKYRLSARVFTRTEGGGKQPLDNNCRVGIDPTGGRDPYSPDVVWSTPTESEGRWTPVSVEATAQTERITVFIRHEMRRANTWNLTLFDDVRLEKP